MTRRSPGQARRLVAEDDGFVAQTWTFGCDRAVGGTQGGNNVSTENTKIQKYKKAHPLVVSKAYVKKLTHAYSMMLMRIGDKMDE